MNANQRDWEGAQNALRVRSELFHVFLKLYCFKPIGQSVRFVIEGLPAQLPPGPLGCSLGEMLYPKCLSSPRGQMGTCKVNVIGHAVGAGASENFLRGRVIVEQG